jgi:hypothetical protein
MTTAQKIKEMQATLDLYLAENTAMAKAFDDLKKRATEQAAEILIFVDRVKQEKREMEDFILSLETELNDAWGFVQDVKDTMGDDTVIRSLLEKYSLDKTSSRNGYVN